MARRNPGRMDAARSELAEAMLVNQREAVKDSHPRDAKGRDRLQRVVVELESAIDDYRRRQAGSQR